VGLADSPAQRSFSSGLAISAIVLAAGSAVENCSNGIVIAITKNGDLTHRAYRAQDGECV
jgi:hypothetical protein